jgi:hypothetical protein
MPDRETPRTRIERLTELPRDGLDALAVDGEGDGGRIVRRLVEEWTGGVFVALRLRTTNPAAARLYERVGFRAETGLSDATHVMVLRSPSAGAGIVA